jgi:hypothetical protein
MFVLIFNAAKSQNNNLFDLQKHFQKNMAEQSNQLKKNAAKDNMNSFRAMRFRGFNNRNLQTNNPIALGIIPNMEYQWPNLGIMPNLKTNPATSGIIPNAATPKN